MATVVPTDALRWSSSTISYSFATSDYGNRAYSGEYTYDSSVPETLRDEVRAAFDRWSQAAEINFVEVADSASVNIRLGMDAIDGKGGTLGETWSWGSRGTYFDADIRFDTADLTYANGSATASDGESFYLLALHEIGHAIGLDHPTADAAWTLMNAYYTGTLDDASLDDVAALQSIYGARKTSAGAEALTGGEGGDSLLGGPGSDTVSGANGPDTLGGGLDIDVVNGGGGDDIVRGGRADDTLYGDAGADQLFGGYGADSLLGGDGNDSLTGAAGGDALEGGAGADVFIFNPNTGYDVIDDFSLSQGDRIYAPGATKSVVAGDYGAEITFSNGSAVVLWGVRASSLTGDWFFS